MTPMAEPSAPIAPLRRMPRQMLQQQRRDPLRHLVRGAYMPDIRQYFEPGRHVGRSRRCPLRGHAPDRVVGVAPTNSVGTVTGADRAMPRAAGPYQASAASSPADGRAPQGASRWPTARHRPAPLAHPQPLGILRQQASPRARVEKRLVVAPRSGCSGSSRSARRRRRDQRPATSIVSEPSAPDGGPRSPRPGSRPSHAQPDRTAARRAPPRRRCRARPRSAPRCRTAHIGRIGRAPAA